MITDDVRILVAEDHPIYREAVRRALGRVPSFRIVAAVADGVTALDVLQSRAAGIAVLDIGLPKMNGIAVVRKIRDAKLPVEVIFLTVSDDRDIFEEALNLGVKGYLLKDCTEAELVRCVETVVSGQNYIGPPMSTYLVEKVQRADQFVQHTPGLELLTAKEWAILKLIADGMSSKEIAGATGIAAKTVDSHRANKCNKLDIHGQHALTRFASLHRHEI